MTISLCKHTHPDGDGPCRGCGLTPDQIRALTAHDGTCHGCHQPRYVWQLGSDWLCTTCWGIAADNAARTGYASWTDLFDHGSDEQVLAALGGAA